MYAAMNGPRAKAYFSQNTEYKIIAACDMILGARRRLLFLLVEAVVREQPATTTLWTKFTPHL